jgi:hypothetical protein
MPNRTVSAPNSRRVEMFAYAVLLAAWSLPPLVIILVLALAPSFLLGSDKMGITAAVWAAASVLLFTVLLIHDHRPPAGLSTQTIQSLMGLFCTLALAIPALAISFIPILGPPADLLASFSAEGSPVTLAPVEEKQKKTLYLIGIDASKSFLKNSADPRIPAIHRTVDSFFTGVTLQSFALSVHPQSVVRAFTFAEGVHELETNLNGEQNPEEKRTALVRSLQTKLARDIESTPDKERNTTDLLGFLDEKVCSCLKGNGYEEVKVVIFSDWIQSPNPEMRDTEAVKTMGLRYNDTMRLFESCLERYGANASFLAFSARPHDRSGDENQFLYENVAAYFRSQLAEKQWLEVPLEAYDEASYDEKVPMPETIFSKIVSADTLYLKYFPGPRWKPLESLLVLPQSKDAKFFLELRSLSHETTPISVQMEPHLTRGFSIGVGEHERTGAIRSENSPVKVWLSRDPQGRRDASIELRIAVPEHSTLYKVPVVVLPVLNRNAVLALMWIVFAVHMFPLILSVKIFLTRFFPPKERVKVLQSHPAQGPPAREVRTRTLDTPPSGR